MLGLQQMSDVLKMSADTIEDIYGDCGVTPPADTQRLIDDLRRLAQEARTEQVNAVDSFSAAAGVQQPSDPKTHQRRSLSHGGAMEDAGPLRCS